MITVEDIQKYLEVSPTYAQKLIDDANGDEDKAYKTFIRKLNEKNSRPAVMEVMWWGL